MRAWTAPRHLLLPSRVTPHEALDYLRSPHALAGQFAFETQFGAGSWCDTAVSATSWGGDERAVAAGKQGGSALESADVSAMAAFRPASGAIHVCRAGGR